MLRKPKEAVLGLTHCNMWVQKLMTCSTREGWLDLLSEPGNISGFTGTSRRVLAGEFPSCL